MEGSQAWVEPPCSEHGLEVVGEKIEVFEEAEEAEVEQNTPKQDVLSSFVVAGPVEHFTDVEIHGSRGEDERQKAVIPSRVKSVAGDEEEGILRPPR